MSTLPPHAHAHEYREVRPMFPSVMIVGAGLGGLMLGTLFERIRVPYHIYERSTESRAMGAAMTLSGNVLPIFEQLGLLQEIERISLPLSSLDLYNANMEQTGSFPRRGLKETTGYDTFIFTRPRLQAILLDQIPRQKISYGKKILRTEEKDGRVIIHCSDKTSYQGDMLVGADGAYSSVRQSLYKRMDDQGLLPKRDMEGLNIGYVAIFGVSRPPNPEKFPQLQDPYCNFSKVLGGHGLGWSAMSVPNNEVCWSLGIQLSEADAKALQFRNSEWGPESNEAMIQQLRELPCPWGGSMRDIVDATPKRLISKVFLEEKMFVTWYHGRTVLLGDACHKMLPTTGLGASNAFQDAVVLANCIFNMPDVSMESITAAFEEYYRQRFRRAQDQFEDSNVMAKTMLGQTLSERVTRFIFMNVIPNKLQNRHVDKTMEYRPQIAWLPLVENRGTAQVLPQEGPRRVLPGYVHGNHAHVQPT